MQLQPVKSSQISAVAHDPATNTLRIQFAPRKDGTPGPVYDYWPIDPGQAMAKHHQDLMAAESVGSHFIKNIKPLAIAHDAEMPKDNNAKFRYRKVS